MDTASEQAQKHGSPHTQTQVTHHRQWSLRSIIQLTPQLQCLTAITASILWGPTWLWGPDNLPNHYCGSK